MTVLFLDWVPTSQQQQRMASKSQAWIFAGESSGHGLELATASLPVDVATIEGQARMMDWLRQNPMPSQIVCSLDSRDFEGQATTFLNAKIIGVTRLLEASLLLNPTICWRFIVPVGGDVWCRACEAYFRALGEGLAQAVPQARIEFLTDTSDWLD